MNPAYSAIELIKENLVKEKQRIQKQLESIEENNLTTVNSLPESHELATSSWEADVYSVVMAVKSKLKKFSDEVDTALRKIDLGTYGQCDKCQQLIDIERLEILPYTASCKSCKF